MKRETRLLRLLLLLPGLAFGCGQPVPSPAPTPGGILGRSLKEINLELNKDNATGKCLAKFTNNADKYAEVKMSHEGAFWLLKNNSCDQAVEFQIRAIATPDTGKKKLPKYCEQTVSIPGDVDYGGDTLLLGCTFPKNDKPKYKGTFQYLVNICADSTCTAQDPELNVKR